MTVCYPVFPAAFSLGISIIIFIILAFLLLSVKGWKNQGAKKIILGIVISLAIAAIIFIFLAIPNSCLTPDLYKFFFDLGISGSF